MIDKKLYNIEKKRKWNFRYQKPLDKIQEVEEAESYENQYKLDIDSVDDGIQRRKFSDGVEENSGIHFEDGLEIEVRNREEGDWNTFRGGVKGSWS